jgi:hypothetical protein
VVTVLVGNPYTFAIGYQKLPLLPIKNKEIREEERG